MKGLLSFSKILCAFTILALSFSGCAAIFHGSSDYVNFTSEPAGCGVFVNGVEKGVTPLELKLKSSREYQIEFKKDGYAPYTYQLNNGLAAGYIVLDVFFTGALGVLIDAATQSWYTLDDDAVHARLSPVK